MPVPCLKPLLLASLLTVQSVQAAAPCADFAARLPNVKRELCDAAKLQPTAARSVQGRTLWMRDVKPQQVTLRCVCWW